METQNCQVEGCVGTIEAYAKVYFDANIEDDLVTLEFSGLNDTMDGNPVALEGELHVVCTEGHEQEFVGFSDETSERISGQPVG